MGPTRMCLKSDIHVASRGWQDEARGQDEPPGAI